MCDNGRQQPSWLTSSGEHHVLKTLNSCRDRHAHPHTHTPTCESHVSTCRRRTGLFSSCVTTRKSERLSELKRKLPFLSRMRVHTHPRTHWTSVEVLNLTLVSLTQHTHTHTYLSVSHLCTSDSAFFQTCDLSTF